MHGGTRPLVGPVKSLRTPQLELLLRLLLLLKGKWLLKLLLSGLLLSLCVSSFALSWFSLSCSRVSVVSVRR